MNPRHPSTSPLAVIAAPALVIAALLGIWAWHKLAAAIIIGGTLWIAGIVGGICAATAWMEERKARGDADERCEALEAELEAKRIGDPGPTSLVPFDVAQARAEFESKRPDLHIVPPQPTGEHDDLPPADESWLDETPLFHDVCFKNWEKR